MRGDSVRLVRSARKAESLAVQLFRVPPHEEIADDEDGDTEKTVLVDKVGEDIVGGPFTGVHPHDVASSLDE